MCVRGNNISGTDTLLYIIAGESQLMAQIWSNMGTNTGCCMMAPLDYCQVCLPTEDYRPLWMNHLLVMCMEQSESISTIKLANIHVFILTAHQCQGHDRHHTAIHITCTHARMIHTCMHTFMHTHTHTLGY